MSLCPSDEEQANEEHTSAVSSYQHLHASYHPKLLKFTGGYLVTSISSFAFSPTVDSQQCSNSMHAKHNVGAVTMGWMPAHKIATKGIVLASLKISNLLLQNT